MVIGALSGIFDVCASFAFIAQHVVGNPVVDIIDA